MTDWPMPEWQRKVLAKYIELDDKCKPDEEVRLAPHPRLPYWMWRIVKKQVEP